MWKTVKLCGITACFMMSAVQAKADNDLVKGLIGGMIGAAIVNSNKANASTSRSKSTRSSISSAQRETNRRIQTALNYFGFPAGVADGVLGSKSRSAISSFQACLGYAMTGQLSSFEQDFLLNSYSRGQAGGQQTLIAVSRLPNGYCGLLQQFRDDLTRPAHTAPAPTPAPQTPTNTVAATQSSASNTNVTTVNVAGDAVKAKELQEEIDKFAEQIALLTEVLKHQNAKEPSKYRGDKISVVQERLKHFDKKTSQTIKQAQKQYRTSIKPTNVNLGTTALRASEIFPKIPYYIAGTNQIGEFWIEPRITDEGYLVYNFNFLDPDAQFARIVEKIQLSPDEVEKTVFGLSKVNEWTEVAQERNIRKRFSQMAVCFPESDCEAKVPGNSSTEVVFLTYEDGSTAGQFKRNKGRSSSTYNISNESGLLLSAYLEYMIDVGSKEFEASTMTDEELSEIFK